MSQEAVLEPFLKNPELMLQLFSQKNLLDEKRNSRNQEREGNRTQQHGG